MRLLQAARLSRLGEASTGIDKQDEAAQRYASVHEHSIVATVADTDVSGSVAPWERPRLGPWLTDPVLMSKYDELVASNLDRLGRNARHLAKLRDWCEDHGKRLTIISPPLHWPPEPDDLASPIIWDVLSRLAEFELSTITRRARETRQWLTANGYLVGRAPFGYRIVPKGEHKTIEPDPDLLPYLRGMVDRALAGSSLMDLCRWLDSEGIPPTRGGIWSPKSVGQVLRNPSLHGRRMSGTGRTLLKVTPIIDLATWRKLQNVLDSNPRRRGAVSSEPALLTGHINCSKCQGVMHFRRKARKHKDGTLVEHQYYRCNGTQREPSRCRVMLRAEMLEAEIDRLMTDQLEGLSDLEIVERVMIPGTGHEDEIAQVGQDMAELLSRYTADNVGEDEYDARMNALRTERSRLRALPGEPDRVEERPTGVTVGEHWRTLDSAGKRRYLGASGIQFYARRGDDGPSIGVQVPPGGHDILMRG